MMHGQKNIKKINGPRYIDLSFKETQESKKFIQVF